MSNVTFDCSRYSKAALKIMREDAAFSHVHSVIDAFLAPKPAKSLEPVAGKVQWRAKQSQVSTTVYPKGYVRLEPNQGNGVLYKAAAVELVEHLTALIANGSIKNYGEG